MSDDTRDVIAGALFEMDRIEPPVDRDHPIWHNYLTDADAIIAALAAKGLVIAPMEPTEAMLIAAGRLKLTGLVRIRGSAYADFYRAMLAAYGGDDD